MKPPLILALLCSVTLLNAQSIPDFAPARYIDTIPSGIYQVINSRYKKEVDNIKASPANKSQVKARYKGLFDETISKFNDDHMMVQSEITEYLTAILERVAQANNLSPKDVNIYAFRTEVPNAVCYGNGVLSVMLGLLARLDTDDQVAYVVCHELGHHLAKDNLRGIENTIAMINDKDTRKNLNKARRSSYYSYSRTRDILDQLDFDFTRHSRAHEYSADSAGLILYLKAGYDPDSALKLLQILGKADEDHYAPLDLEKFLTAQGIKPEPSWLQYANENKWHKDRKRPDSLRTHPNTTERTIAVSRLLSNMGYTYEGLNAPKELRGNVYKTRAQFEMVEAEFHFKHYSRALYNSIQLSLMYPDDPWLKAMTGRCLYEIYTRQKNHTLGKSLDLPDALYSESYNKLLTFLHKLRLVEIELITYQYMTGQPESAYKNEHFIYSLWLASNLGVSKLDPEKVREDYMSLFPNGTYARLMK